MTRILQRIRRKWKWKYRCIICKTVIEQSILWYYLRAGRCSICGFPLIPIERKRMEDWEE